MKNINLPYAPIGNTMKALAVLSGFSVNSFQPGLGTVGARIFGIGLYNQNAGATGLSVDVYVFGRAYLSTISVYYISY